MPPFHGGGEMIMLVQLHETTYKDPPHKFEAGTVNIADSIVLGTAIDYLQGLGMEAIRHHERQLVAYALGQLREVEGVRMFGPEDVEQRGGAIALDIARVHPHDVAQVLDQEGIAVRAGHHCAQPLHRRLGLAASTRASLYLYNTPQDIDALVRGLEVVRRLFTPRTSVLRDR
jgi:cysteine desulfurase/selenocysteine lyase